MVLYNLQLGRTLKFCTDKRVSPFSSKDPSMIKNFLSNLIEV